MEQVKQYDLYEFANIVKNSYFNLDREHYVNCMNQFVTLVTSGNFNVEIFYICIDMIQFAIKYQQFELASQLLYYLKKRTDDFNKNEYILMYLRESIHFCEATKKLDEIEELYEKYYQIIKQQLAELNAIKISNIKTKMLIQNSKVENELYIKEVIKLRKQSEHDELTSLANRYLLKEYSEEYFKKAKKEQKKFGVIIVDVDHFKEFNDYYGHLGGDACLRAVADSILECCDGQFCARFGGDEFFIITYDMSVEEVYEIAVNIKNSIEAKDLHQHKDDYSSAVSVSQGIVVGIPKNGQSLENFLNTADDALFEGKRNGKNSISIKELPTITS